jgi:dTDP-4-dehydrorhamnose 3,5-epimerase
MALTALPTELDGPLLLRPDVFGDERGFFAETYRESWLGEHGITGPFVQDNHSRSAYGVVRGLHFQLDPPAGKLVRCGRGSIVDVLVDVRRGSPAFGRWEAYELSDENHHVLWAPPGFAHGFCVTSEVADVLYKQTAYWSPQADRAVQLADPAIGIAWPVPEADRVISERDASAPRLADVAGLL